MKIEDTKYLNILLIDDDFDDRTLFCEAIAELGIKIGIETLSGAEELMSKLQKQSLPDIIFLDLNMPIKNGFECLTEIRENKIMKDIFISVYSTTSNQKEIDITYQAGANLFIRKPNSFNELKIILTKVFSLNWEKYFPRPEKEKFVLTVDSLKNDS